jgi:hypothetical protein
MVSSSSSAFRPTALALREKRAFGVGEPDPPSAEPLFEQPILGL